MTSLPTIQAMAQLTLFAVDSPVRMSAKQERGPALKKATALACSMNLCESFAWWDRNTSSWKTSQRSLLTDWTLYSERWPKQGLMLNGHVFRRQMWAPAIGGIGGGVLPTPVAQTGQGGAKGLDGGSGARQILAAAGFPRAVGAPTALLTPTANDWKGKTNWKNANRHGPQRLPDCLLIGEATYLNPSFVEEMMGFPVGWTD
jgi:hypothetical protein